MTRPRMVTCQPAERFCRETISRRAHRPEVIGMGEGRLEWVGFGCGDRLIRPGDGGQSLTHVPSALRLYDRS